MFEDSETRLKRDILTSDTAAALNTGTKEQQSYKIEDRFSLQVALVTFIIGAACSRASEMMR